MCGTHFEASSAPILISHSHLAAPGADHPRLLSEEHARMVADAGGVFEIAAGAQARATRAPAVRVGVEPDG